MIISDYSIGMESSHKLTTYERKEETLVRWSGGADSRARAYEDPVSVSLSAEALSRIKNMDNVRTLSTAFSNQAGVSLDLSALAIKSLVPKPTSGCCQPDVTEDITGIEELKVKIIEELFYSITGKKVKINLFRQSDANKDTSSVQNIMARINAGSKGGGATSEPQSVGWGIDYHSVEESYEKEDTSFCASGVVKTADGREIMLDVNLQMSREFCSREEFSLKAGDALIDPLVINFSGVLPSLDENSRIQFDINIDGSKESIAALSQGSGYLAIDKNGDGRINDGSELFGPSSGNGFEELASLDSDKNGWLDENDSAYYNVKIWNISQDGSETLFDIAAAGIGAIYIGRAETEFSMTGTDGALEGKIRETGIFLREDGSAGTVQEIDVVSS